MFRGTFEQRIDEKGRVNVPVTFRDVLKGPDELQLMVTNFTVRKVRCLDVYPYAAWLRLEARLQDEDLPSNVIEFFQNYYFPGAHECQLDRQGRLLIPPRLRDHARLGKDLVFTGVGSKFRIWDRDAWQPVFDGAEENVDDPNVVSTLRI